MVTFCDVPVTEVFFHDGIGEYLIKLSESTAVVIDIQSGPDYERSYDVTIAPNEHVWLE